MPGSSPTKPTKLPLIVGSSTSSRVVMLPPTSLEVTSSIGVSAETFTTSLSDPTSSGTSTDVVLPISSSTSRRRNFLKPCSSALTSYRPGTMPPTMKVPSWLETVSRNMPVS